MFMTTRWTIVFQAAAEESGSGRPALSEIIQKYWRPLYFYARHRGLSAADAEDATQSFLAGFIEGKLLERADPARGRFRTFLLTAWKRYLIDLHRHTSRERRGGLVSTLSIDTEQGERDWLLSSSENTDPDRVFLAGWASQLVEETLRRLRAEYASSQRTTVFDTLCPYLSVPLNSDLYQEISTKIAVTAGACKVALHRLRQRFAQCLREVVEETVENPEDVEEELNELFQVLIENSILPGGSEV